LQNVHPCPLLLPTKKRETISIRCFLSRRANTNRPHTTARDWTGTRRREPGRARRGSTGRAPPPRTWTPGRSCSSITDPVSSGRRLYLHLISFPPLS
jgi:hypothetical protein